MSKQKIMMHFGRKSQVTVLPIILFMAVISLSITEVQAACTDYSAKTLNRKAKPYKSIIQQAAKRYKVEPALIKAVITTESCFKDTAVSPKEAAGLMQLMPETAFELDVMDVFDPVENIHAGTRYLRFLLRRYKGSVIHAVAAYNAGPGRIKRNQPVTIKFKETRNYIKRVLAVMHRLESGKKSKEKAKLLIAEWDEAEARYQAELRGEKWEPPAKEDEQQDEKQLAKQDKAKAATQQATTKKTEHGRVQTVLAVNPQAQNAAGFNRGAKAIPVVWDGQQAKQPVVKHAAVVRSQSATVTPTKPPLNQARTITPAPSQAAAPQTTTQATMLPCQYIPASVTRLAQPTGSGRYRAYVYPAGAGETLSRAADKLGVEVETIVRLNNIPADVFPTPGRMLKVAECLN